MLTGISGAGKSDQVVRPLVARAAEEGRIALHVDVPSRPTELEQEITALLLEELTLQGHADVGAEVRAAGSLAGALRALLRRGALVVVDELQRTLGADSRQPGDPFSATLLKMARRGADKGCLWLVSNRELDPGWTEPFHVAVLEPPDQAEDAQRIVLKAIGTGDAESRFPTARRREVVRRLGANPRVLRLLGNLLRTHTLDDLLAPETSDAEAPADPALVEAIEHQLLARACAGLSDPANALLRDLCVLRDREPWELVKAIGAHLGDVRGLTRALRDRYLLELRSDRYAVHPAAREALAPQLHADSGAWRDAHRRAGEWYARPLRAAMITLDDATLGLRLSAARYHLEEAGATEALREVLGAVSGYVERRFGWTTPRPSSDGERDARVELLQSVLEEPGHARAEFQLAKLLAERARPGDHEAALPHAARATSGQDLSDPWILWIQLTRSVRGPEAAIEAARAASGAVAPRKSLYSVYQILGSLLDHAGRAEEAIDALLEGAARAVGREHRLVEAAATIAATLDEAITRRVRETALRIGGHEAPVALCDVILLEQAGHWSAAAQAAQTARRSHPTYLPLALHETIAWLGDGRPEQAREALGRFPRDIEHGERVGATWLSAFVELRCGDIGRASQLLGVYLGGPAPDRAPEILAALLREWDERAGTFGEPNPAWICPILPAAMSGLGATFVRPEHGPGVLPKDLTAPAPITGGAPVAPSILAVATEWSSGNGGLSTLNRQLCLALAEEGARVACVVLAATPEEQRQAGKVSLVVAPKSPGLTDDARLARKPALPFSPDVIIGHARVTGPAARTLAEDHFPNARRLHFIHMAPDEIEWLKPGRGDDAGVRAEERTRIEIELGRTAARVVAIGPRLHERFLMEMSAIDGAPAPLRLDPGFDVERAADRVAPPGAPWRILMLGRLEDAELKGLDIAARAFGLVVGRRDPSRPPLELVIRGAPEATSEKLRTQVQKWAKSPGLRVVVRPYTTEEERLDADLRTASLVLMPSRSEGFGLVGLESIVAGTPLLATKESGLARLIHEHVDGEQYERHVIPVAGDEGDADRWARGIERALGDREAAFRRVGELRALLGARKTWASAARGLLQEIARSG